MTKYFIHRKSDNKIITLSIRDFSEAVKMLKNLREKYVLIEFGLGKIENSVKEFNIKEK